MQTDAKTWVPHASVLVHIEAAETEWADIRQRMNRLWHLVENTDLTVDENLSRIRHYQENQERLERAANVGSLIGIN